MTPTKFQDSAEVKASCSIILKLIRAKSQSILNITRISF